MAFEIRKSTGAPPARGSTPKYEDAMAALAKLQIGQEMDLPYDLVKKEHARTVAQRYMRKEGVTIVTRSVKDKAGEEIALRVFRVAPTGDAPEAKTPKKGK